MLSALLKRVNIIMQEQQDNVSHSKKESKSNARDLKHCIRNED